MIQISNPEELSSINDAVHDNEFNKDKIFFDPESSILKIEFNREAWEKRKTMNKILFIKKVAVPFVKCTLKISHVENYQIEEGLQERPGSDEMFNIITFDEEQKRIWISTIYAKGISVKVRDLNISIEETDEVTRKKTRLSIFS